MKDADDEQRDSRIDAPENRAGEDDGVDVSLIRWLLSLSVAERLSVLQAQANSMAKLRSAIAGR